MALLIMCLKTSYFCFWGLSFPKCEVRRGPDRSFQLDSQGPRILGG